MGSGRTATVHWGPFAVRPWVAQHTSQSTAPSVPAQHDRRWNSQIIWRRSGSERHGNTEWKWSSWWQSSEKWWQVSSWDEHGFFFQSQCQGVSLTGNGDSLVSHCRCKHYTTPTRASHSRTRFFSRLAQDLSHRVRNRCVSQNSHSSHLAQHVTRALVVVAFTLEHHLTFHLHSNPTLYPTIYQTFIDVFFTTQNLPCKDPSNLSFGLLAETHSPTELVAHSLAVLEECSRRVFKISWNTRNHLVFPFAPAPFWSAMASPPFVPFC